MRAIETTNARTTLLNQTQLAELRKAKAAHEAYKVQGEKSDSQEAWNFMSSTASVLNTCSSGLSANRDFAPVARTFSVLRIRFRGCCARAAGYGCYKVGWFCRIGTATAGLGICAHCTFNPREFFLG